MSNLGFQKLHFRKKWYRKKYPFKVKTILLEEDQIFVNITNKVADLFNKITRRKNE